MKRRVSKAAERLAHIMQVNAERARRFRARKKAAQAVEREARIYEVRPS